MFVAKEKTLCVPLLEGLLKYWPFANRLKETIFLTELAEVLEGCDFAKIEHLIPRLFKRIIQCVRSNDMVIADRALFLFERDRFLELMQRYSSVTYPIIVPSIRDMGIKPVVSSYAQTFVTLRAIVREKNTKAYYDALGP